jgi:hypothetical protein
MSEFYAQDTFTANPRLTVDYGARFVWYTPYVKVDDQVANFDPARFDPAKAPRLYYPATVNGTRVAQDPVTGQTQNAIFIGAYVPGTGDPNNGMSAGQGGASATLTTDRPRLGVTYDLTGKGDTIVHASTGVFLAHVSRRQPRKPERNPPYPQPHRVLQHHRHCSGPARRR